MLRNWKSTRWRWAGCSLGTKRPPCYDRHFEMAQLALRGFTLYYPRGKWFERSEGIWSSVGPRLWTKSGGQICVVHDHIGCALLVFFLCLWKQIKWDSYYRTRTKGGRGFISLPEELETNHVTHFQDRSEGLSCYSWKPWGGAGGGLTGFVTPPENYNNNIRWQWATF